ncbi:MAG: PQQ-binding-like beta-propeller repeat protein [Planctomycetota bacterium]
MTVSTMHKQEHRNLFSRLARDFGSRLSLAILFAVSVCSSAKSDATDLELLKQHGIECNRQSLAAFFESLNPKGEIIPKTKALLAKLGDEDFRTREEAMLKLLASPQLPLDLLKAAAEDKDPEIQWRAKVLLSQSGSQSRALLREALIAVSDHGVSGLCGPLLSCTNYFDGSPMQRLAQKALFVTATEADAAILRAAAKDEDPVARALAFRGLASVLGEEAVQDLRVGLTDSVEQVRLYTAFELAKRGDRDVLDTFVGLLDAEEIKIRSQAVQILRTMTGQRFAFSAYGPTEERQTATDAWRAWLVENKEIAELNSDVSLTPARIGRILVCYYNTDLVVEYDEERNEVWSAKVPQPWGCQGLPNGHRLITSYASSSVIEYDEKGDEVWRTTVTGKPVQAQRLDNGNTLVALYNQNEIVEINRDGVKVASIVTTGKVNHVFRTDDGHTLVSCRDGAGVLEYDKNGKQLGSIHGGRPFSARRLDNGNTLLADSASNSVIEVDSERNTVWTKSGLGNPLDGFRLDNGNTLIADRKGVTEFDASGTSVWSDSRGYAIRISYY